MTSYEFEVAAKNAVIKVLEENYDIMVSIKDLELVWFTHVVGNKKCLIYGHEMGKMYAEVTYVKDSMTMYVDIYKKIQHEAFAGDGLAELVTVKK